MFSSFIAASDNRPWNEHDWRRICKCCRFLSVSLHSPKVTLSNYISIYRYIFFWTHTSIPRCYMETSPGRIMMNMMWSVVSSSCASTIKKHNPKSLVYMDAAVDNSNSGSLQVVSQPGPFQEILLGPTPPSAQTQNRCPSMFSLLPADQKWL